MNKRTSTAFVFCITVSLTHRSSFSPGDLPFLVYPVSYILPRLLSVVNVLRALRATVTERRERECERELAFVFCERIHHRRTHLLLLRRAFLYLYSRIVECKQRDSGNQLSLVRHNRERENGSYLRRNCGTSATVWMSHLFARDYIKRY